MLVVRSGQNDPYWNLSVEEALFRGYEGTEPVLYLWVNQPSVILGRNQNAWRECNVSAMQAGGVLLVRRDSGGGAVYHDLGNLLFSFVMPPDYEPDYSYGILLEAAARLGIKAERSGRNDVHVLGRKFSGSAYMRSKRAFLHHGTVLVSTDLDKLGSYLNPSPHKMQAKGVASVRQRVVNLAQVDPSITVERMCGALMEACGATRMRAVEDLIDPQAVRQAADRRSNWDFVYGATPLFDLELAVKLTHYEIQLLLRVQHARIEQASVYTDALDAQLAPRVAQALTGQKLRPDVLAGVLKPIDEELSAWVAGQAL